jgi:hypothetical protein
LQSTWGARLFPTLNVITNQVSNIKGELSYGAKNFIYIFNEQRHICYYKIKVKMIGKTIGKHKEIKTMRINITHPFENQLGNSQMLFIPLHYKLQIVTHSKKSKN